MRQKRIILSVTVRAELYISILSFHVENKRLQTIVSKLFHLVVTGNCFHIAVLLNQIFTQKRGNYPECYCQIFTSGCFRLRTVKFTA